MIKHHKVVSVLPSTLEADSVYFVRAGSGFDLFATNGSGTITAYPINHPTSPVAVLGDMAESPASSVADFDFLTMTLADALKPGATFEAQFFGTQSQAAVTQTLTFYVKINGGAAITVGSVGTGSALQSYRAISGRAMLTFASVGASGSYLLGGDFTVNSLTPFSSNSSSPRSASTLSGMTITLGIRCSVANAANINRISCASIKQVS